MALMGGLALWLFAIPWTAFALFWMAGRPRFKTPNFKSPAVFPSLWAALRAHRPSHAGLADFPVPQGETHLYIITDRRALIFETAPP
ncbi:MAG: hypothetical protein IPI26_05795 [Elusimicrobia bacterium]|nr:hypothetical protein [Elusimicrobiota bacterium]